MAFRKLPWLLVLIAFLAITGCTQRIVDFTIISSKNVDLSKAATFTRGTDRIDGKDSVAVILFPLGNPSVKEACDRAIEKVPGCVALVDGVITYKFFYFIFGEVSYYVEGTPLIDPSLAANSDLASPYMICYTDPQTRETELKYVSQEEYYTVKAALDENDAETLQHLIYEGADTN